MIEELSPKVSLVLDVLYNAYCPPSINPCPSSHLAAL